MATKRRAVRGTGSIFKDKARKRFVGKIVIRGERHRVYGRTKTEAREKLNDVIHDGGRPRTRRVPPTACQGHQVLQGLQEVPRSASCWTSGCAATSPAATSPRPRRAGTAGRSRCGPTRSDTSRRGPDREPRRAGPGDDPRQPRSRQRVAGQGAVDVEAGPPVRGSGAATPTTTRRPSSRPRHRPPARDPRQALQPDEARALHTALRDEPGELMWALSLRLGLRPGEAAALPLVGRRPRPRRPVDQPHDSGRPGRPRRRVRHVESRVGPPLAGDAGRHHGLVP